MASPALPSSPSASEAPTILIADDSADTRDFLTIALTGEGYRVISTRNGADTLELMRVAPPHAVLLDLMMPILDGWKVLEECNLHADLRQIPVICMSALSGVEERVRASGAIAFVPKPIDFADLLVALRLFATPPSAPRSPEPQVAGVATVATRIRSAIRESEYLYRTLVEQAWDGVLLFDADGDCLWANTRAAELFGYELEQLCQVNYRNLVCGDGHPFRDTSLSERRCRRKDGGIFTGEISVRTIDWRTQILVRDITKAKLRDEELRQSQKMEAMGQLAGGIAHDFNNVLTVIMGLSEFVMDQVGPDHAATSDLRDIHSAVCRASALTQQLLGFSRKQVLNIHAMDVHAHVEQFAALLRRIMPENIEVRLQLRATATLIDADPTQVDQLLLNLAVNSKAAMPNGGLLVLSTDNVGDRDNLDVPNRIRITIADTGSGMDAETQRRMFEPFFTTKPVGQGTGLGLAMVYGAVQQFGGTIAVESRPGTGTTFRLDFPTTNRSESVSEVEIRTPAQRTGEQGTVLVVEDEDSVRVFVARALEQLGYRVLVADSPLSALQIVRDRRDPVDLVITDVMMPDLTGPDFVRELRRIHADSAVLYISGYFADPHSLSAGQTGIDYLAKPFTVARLAAKVAALVEQPPKVRLMPARS